MPIPELNNILLHEFANFKVSQLHNNVVIIDAEDFSGYFYEHLKLPIEYGGEYLSYAVQLKEFLNEMKLCKICPTFLFGSDCERVGLQLTSQLQKIQSTIKSLSSLDDIKKRKSSLIPDCMFLQSVLTDILTDMEIKLLKSPYPRIQSCVSLATYLHCPIIASSPEYFLVGSPHVSSNSSPRFIPLSLMKLKCFGLKENCYCEPIDAESQSSQTSCRFLTAHEFVPTSSRLYSVHPVCRPLIGLLLGTDSIPQSRLPDHLYSIMNSSGKGSYKTRRFNTLISWFSQFTNNNPQIPIDEILKCYSSKERVNLLKMFTESLVGYFPNVYLGQKLSEFLHSQTSTQQNQLNPPIFVYNPQEPNSTIETKLWQYRLNNLFKGQFSNILGSVDFTRGWSTSLIQFYCKHKLAPFILTPIYCQGGVVMPLLIENSTNHNNLLLLSAYEITLPLRWMHYRLLYGIELQLLQKQKLIGLNPYILEYYCIGQTLTTYEIQIEPYILNQHNNDDDDDDTTDSVLASTIGFTFSHFNAEMKWIVSLALTLTFWFRATTTATTTTSTTQHQINSLNNNNSNDLRNSSIVLTAAAIAITNYFNIIESEKQSNEHCKLLITFLKSKLSDRSSPSSTPSPSPSSKSSSPSVDLSIVHHFTSLHTIYTYLRSLTQLLDELLPTERKTNSLNFLPSWILFPSGRLFHYLAMHIESIQPNDRFRLTLRYWLPRLYRIPKLNSEFALKLKQLADIYEHVINLTCEMIHSPVVTMPNILYAKRPTIIPDNNNNNNNNFLKKPHPTNTSNSVVMKPPNTENNRLRKSKSEFIKKSHPPPLIHNSNNNIGSDTSVPPPTMSKHHCYSQKSLISLKKQSQKLPYHLRPTGYAARLRARLEETP